MATSKPVVLITGANTGLGYEAVKALMTTSECDIIIGSRDAKKGEDAMQQLKQEVPDSKSTLSVVQIDVTSDDSIKKAFEQVSSKHGLVDVLVNNAGASYDAKVDDGSMSIREALNATWDTNVTGAHIVSDTFIPLILKSSQPRLIFITSGTSSLIETENLEHPLLKRINESPPAGWPKPKIPNPTTFYRSSKTGMNMLVRQWHRILLNDGVKVFAVSPGFLATGLAGHGREALLKMGAKEPHIGGEFLRDVIIGKRDEQAGLSIRQEAVQSW